MQRELDRLRAQYESPPPPVATSPVSQGRFPLAGDLSDVPNTSQSPGISSIAPPPSSAVNAVGLTPDMDRGFSELDGSDFPSQQNSMQAMNWEESPAASLVLPIIDSALLQPSSALSYEPQTAVQKLGDVQLSARKIGDCFSM
jgi:hypothetical protein